MTDFASGAWLQANGIGASQQSGGASAQGWLGALLGVAGSDAKGLFSDAEGWAGKQIGGLFGSPDKRANGLYAKLMANIKEGLQKAGEGIVISAATDTAGLIGAPMATPIVAMAEEISRL